MFLKNSNIGSYFRKIVESFISPVICQLCYQTERSSLKDKYLHEAVEDTAVQLLKISILSFKELLSFSYHSWHITGEINNSTIFSKNVNDNSLLHIVVFEKETSQLSLYSMS